MILTPKHIGIIGCSSEGAALCYKAICSESPRILGPYAHPEVSMHTFSLSKYMEYIETNDLLGMAGLLLASANKLKQMGVDFLISPDNPTHQAFDYAKKDCQLPWLHIGEVVVGYANARKFKTLGILGTKWLIDSNVYPDKLKNAKLDWILPSKEDKIEMSRIIMDELVYGVLNHSSIVFFQEVIERLKFEGCDAIILGCTEISLIVDDKNSSLPTLDSTRLLATKAIELATDSNYTNTVKS